MSSLCRSMERKMLRYSVEKENAAKRTEAIKKRKKGTDSLGLERNIVLFRKAWFTNHYAKYFKEDKDNEVSVIKRKGDKGNTKSKSRRNTQKINNLINKFRFSVLNKKASKKKAIKTVTEKEN